MPLLEPNFYALWLGRQTAKGTPNLTPDRRPIMVSGDFSTARDDGEENYSDLTKYGARTDWVNSLLGSGEPGIEATPTITAYLAWLMHGAETVTASGTGVVPAYNRHAVAPAVGLGHYFTAFLRVGQSVVRRHRFDDCIITRLGIEASSANKAVRITPRILSLDPGAVFDTDPTAGLPTERPFLHTDLSVNAGAASDGSLTLDGTVYRGVTQWSFAIDDAWDVVYGDDARPYDFQQGNPTVTVGATLHLDAAAWQRWNVLYYGTATPAAGTKPLRRVPPLGSWHGILRQRGADGAYNGRELNAEVPGVKWTLPDAPAPNPDGGGVELALTGTMRPVAGQPAYRMHVDTDPAVGAFT